MTFHNHEIWCQLVVNQQVQNMWLNYDKGGAHYNCVASRRFILSCTIGTQVGGTMGIHED